MGLDDFKSEGSTKTKQKSSSSSSNKSSSSKSGKSSSKNEPFKVVGVGNKTKTFKTEEQWDEAVEYIEDELGFDIENVLNWRNQYRHRVLHVAIVNTRLKKNETFDVTKDCDVCGHTFEFPRDWDFMEYKSIITCPEHEFEEVAKAYKMN